MGAFSTVQVGRMVLREDRDSTRGVNAQTSGITAKITGQQTFPSALTSAQVEQQSADIASSLGMLVPVVFTEKANYNGYYIISDWQVNQSKYVADGANLAPWTMSLDLVGSDTEIDIESRLGGAQTRSNSYGLTTGERDHCPPVAAYGYFAGAAVPVQVSRTGSDGALKVYRSIAAGVYPRWGCPVAGYGLGRCRFLSSGFERTGIMFPANSANWELNNSLVRVKPLALASNVVEISAFTGGAFQAKNYDIQANGASLGVMDSVTVIQNDYHRATVRMMKTVAALGRVTVDITLRRGSRNVEVYIQSSTSTTLKMVRATAEAGTQSANSTLIRATAADGQGNRYVIGSANTYVADTANGGISKAAVVSFDVVVGVEIAAAPSGDLAADLYNQYLGAPSELTTGVRR